MIRSSRYWNNLPETISRDASDFAMVEIPLRIGEGDYACNFGRDGKRLYERA